MDPLILPFGGKSPKIHPSAFIAPGCKIIGDVEIGANASVWYNCVIRADVNHIRIGAGTTIPDGTFIHCDSDKNGRSEERRVGKEWVSKCSSRWWPRHKKKKKKK